MEDVDSNEPKPAFPAPGAIGQIRCLTTVFPAQLRSLFKICLPGECAARDRIPV
jgi:hypothetical protein